MAVPFFQPLIGERKVVGDLAGDVDISVALCALGDDFTLLALVCLGLFGLGLGLAGNEQHAHTQYENGDKAENTQFHIDPNPFQGS